MPVYVSSNDPAINAQYRNQNRQFLNSYPSAVQPKLYGVPLWVWLYGYHTLFNVLWISMTCITQNYLNLLLVLFGYIVTLPSYASLSRLLRALEISFDDGADNSWNAQFNRALIIASARSLYPTNATFADGDNILLRHSRAIWPSILCIPSALTLQTMYDMKSIFVVLMMNHLVLCELVTASFSLSLAMATTLMPWKQVNKPSNECGNHESLSLVQVMPTTELHDANDGTEVHRESTEIDDKIAYIKMLGGYLFSLTTRGIHIFINMILRWVEIIALPFVHGLGIMAPQFAKNAHQTIVSHAMQPYPGVDLSFNEIAIANQAVNYEDKMFGNRSIFLELRYHPDLDPVVEQSPSTQ